MDSKARLHLEWISSAEAQKFVQVITAFTEKIRRMGPNPLRVHSGNSAGGRMESGRRVGKTSGNPA